LFVEESFFDSLKKKSPTLCFFQTLAVTLSPV